MYIYLTLLSKFNKLIDTRPYPAPTNSVINSYIPTSFAVNYLKTNPSS